ncbi:hypothetical protein T35B1_16796 [Salinisphaera shabanensis T35B1]
MLAKALAALFLVLVLATAQAEVFKCPQADGTVTYTDKGCDGRGKRLDIAQPVTIQPPSSYMEETRAMVEIAEKSQERKAAWRRYKQKRAQDALRRRGHTPYMPSNQTRYSDMPSVGERMAQRRAEREAAKERRSAASDTGRPLVDPRTGQVLQPTGGGNYVNPRNGDVYTGAAGGVVNTKTGRFSPTH